MTVILAIALSQVICHVTHVTIIESHIYIPYYHKLTEQQFGAAQCLAASRPIAVLCYKLPIILKYCSLLLDTYTARKNASIIYLGLLMIIIELGRGYRYGKHTNYCKYAMSNTRPM